MSCSPDAETLVSGRRGHDRAESPIGKDEEAPDGGVHAILPDVAHSERTYFEDSSASFSNQLLVSWLNALYRLRKFGIRTCAYSVNEISLPRCLHHQEYKQSGNHDREPRQ